MVAAVVFCPQAPALVPEVGRGLDAELGEVRRACRDAIRRADGLSDGVVVLGGADDSRPYPAGTPGRFAGFGAHVEVSLGTGAGGADELPPSLSVGAWLLRDALGADRAVSAWSVGPHDAPDVAVDSDVMLLVVGDGSARRTEKAPGYLDPRAVDHDAATARALRDGRPDLLVRRSEDEELLVAGSAAWDVTARLTRVSRWRAELLYDGAPFGVGYFVGLWLRE